MSEIKVELVFKEDPAMFLHQEWLSGNGADFEFKLVAGTGCGNGALGFWLTKKGEATRYLLADIRTVVAPLVKACCQSSEPEAAPVAEPVAEVPHE